MIDEFFGGGEAVDTVIAVQRQIDRFIQVEIPHVGGEPVGADASASASSLAKFTISGRKSRPCAAMPCWAKMRA